MEVYMQRGVVISLLVAFIVGTYYSYNNFSDEESCRSGWVKDTVPGLKGNLSKLVHGQHIAVNTVSNTITSYLRNQHTKKPLTMAFLGKTGTGKNFVSEIVAKHIYEKGMSSKYVHFWSGVIEFDDSGRRETYIEQIRKWVTGNITACPRQLFIFDEVPLMPDGLLNVLQPFLSPSEIQSDGVDYSKAIYIFLSNEGGKSIHEKTSSSTVPRENLELATFEDTIKSAIGNSGGFKSSTLIKSELIGAYVPFLPLEERHVKKCVYDSFESVNYTSVTLGSEIEQYVTDVMNVLPFTEANGKRYSPSGCKSVSDKVNLKILD